MAGERGGGGRGKRILRCVQKEHAGGSCRERRKSRERERERGNEEEEQEERATEREQKRLLLRGKVIAAGRSFPL